MSTVTEVLTLCYARKNRYFRRSHISEANSKTIVFGILERHGKIHTEIIPNVAKKALQAAIRGRVALDRIIHSDGWRGYDGLVDRGYKKHFRVNQRRLAKFNGVLEKNVNLGGGSL